MISIGDVVNYVGLGYFLGSNLCLGAQVHPVIVSEMVTTRDGRQLQTSIDHEVNKSRLHVKLARLGSRLPQ